MDTILNLEQSTAIYYVSHILLISSVYAFYQKHYHLFIAPAAIFVTSIHYWKKPDYSYRRYLDMLVVWVGFLRQHFYAYNMKYANIYYILMILASSCFPIGIYLHKKDSWKSTYAHIMLHLLANIGNIILYSSPSMAESVS